MTIWIGTSLFICTGRKGFRCSGWRGPGSTDLWWEYWSWSMDLLPTFSRHLGALTGRSTISFACRVILMMKVLSRMIRKAVKGGVLEGFAWGVRIILDFFAVRMMCFEAVSGLRVNAWKYEIGEVSCVDWLASIFWRKGSLHIHIFRILLEVSFKGFSDRKFLEEVGWVEETISINRRKAYLD